MRQAFYASGIGFVFSIALAIYLELKARTDL